METRIWSLIALGLLLCGSPVAGKSRPERLAAGALPASAASQQPVKVGEEVRHQLRSPRFSGPRTPGEVTLAWTEEIHYPGATYIAPHFQVLALPPGAHVVVRSPDGVRQWTYPDPDKGRVGPAGFWGIHIEGDTAVVELFASVPVAAGAVLIDRFARGLGEWESVALGTIGEEAICGTDDTREARCYASSEPTAYLRSRAVARLLINGTSGCTGWLVGSQGHVMTNQHCIGSSSAAQNTDFELIAEGPTCSTSCKAAGACRGVVVATSSTLVKANSSLDYSLVRLPNNPTGTYGYLQMRGAGPRVDERIYIPQHPQFWGKRLALVSTDSHDQSGFCEIFGLSEPGCTGSGLDVGYFADTQGGSSGSPVIAYGDHQVVALHHCASCPNRGVPIDDVIGSLGSSLPTNSVATSCSGTSGQWQGCRGTGCHVCSELVANYPLYFKNNPLCISNPNCQGSYFTCSSKCPAPDSADACNGTSGQWQGCRGTGCHVCSELVANYACYFRNHPFCITNGNCQGSYFTCNANCPAPTAADRC